MLYSFGYFCIFLNYEIIHGIPVNIPQMSQNWTGSVNVRYVMASVYRDCITAVIDRRWLTEIGKSKWKASVPI